MQSAELQSSLAEQINAKWHEARVCAQDVEHQTIAGFNALRECGILLGRGWKEIQGKLDLPEQSIQMCLTFARKHPEPVTDSSSAIRLLPEIRMTTGYLPFPDGHGPQQLHSPSFFSVIAKQMVAFRSEWRKQLSRSPLEQWEYPALEQFVYQLEPAVEELNAIYTNAKAQLAARSA